MMDTNVHSTFLYTRHAVPLMLSQRSGTILMISLDGRGLRPLAEKPFIA
jgi:NADP-dependent 3-hydroxy acid dehydrogenase YdfG